MIRLIRQGECQANGFRLIGVQEISVINKSETIFIFREQTGIGIIKKYLPPFLWALPLLYARKEQVPD